MVDGGFYRKRAAHLWGKKTAENRAKELNAYCQAHLHDKDGQEARQLYRVFYYDCKPLGRREGIDFILDPMWADIKADLFEHIDGLKSQWKKKEEN